MKTVQVSKLQCLRCGHEWIPRTEIVTVCPKCKSYFWDRAKKEQKSQEETNGDQ
ncbi:MAG: hypothetical protein DDT33_01642 [Firmicutes bacterium]|nr:hypothetical protein [Bacillota bacterium]